MPTKTQETLRHTIGRRVRQVRQERRWTQVALAKILGLSQNRLSEIEYGKGSFTAEQLLIILQTFNVPIDSFVPPKDAVSELQNALARLGATHLAESTDVLPTQRLGETLAVIRETLASAESSRQITALAPVLVNNSNGLNFVRLYAEVQAGGLSNRLGWVVENTLEAIAAERLAGTLTLRWKIRYKRAGFLLKQFLMDTISGPRTDTQDILDPGIASEETLKEVEAQRSGLSRRWHIITTIEPEDFRRALEAARGPD